MLVHATGYHGASWLHPSTDPAASTSIDWYRDTALLAERGLFDLFFIADTPAARTTQLEAYSRFPMFMNVFEPITLLSTLAGPDHAHRPRRHGEHELLRALQHRAAIRLARPSQPRARGVERGDLGE